MRKRLAAHPRAYILLIAAGAMVLMLVLVIGAIRFTGANQVGAITKARSDRLNSCGQAAKRALLTKLSLANLPDPAGLVQNVGLDESLPDSTSAGAQTRVMTAHFDESGASVTLFKLNPAAMGASRSQVRDMANTPAQSLTLGGQYYAVVAKCREPSGQETEAEFVVRLGGY